MFQVLLNPGIHGPPGQGTDRSESVRDLELHGRSGPGPTGFGPWIPRLSMTPLYMIYS